MAQSRRAFMATALGASLLPFGLSATGEAALPPTTTPLNVILPREYDPPNPSKDTGYNYKLTRATLDFVQEHYRGRNLPVWGKPLDEIDLEKRVTNIIYWVLLGVNEHKKIYPVDPVWLVSQIMAESFFYEFAVSPAFAVGICQFIPSTARAYGMTLYDPEDRGLSVKKPEASFSLAEYIKLRKDLRRVRSEYRDLCGSQTEHLKALLESIREGRNVPDVDKHLRYLVIQDELDEKIRAARDGYRDFLRANFEGRSIFNNRDLAFLMKFDERVTYRKPVLSMVQMMARGLRARNGNILAAASGYNAGLSSTRDVGLYEPFGRIPNITETSTYISRIFINHHQIVERMG